MLSNRGIADRWMRVNRSARYATLLSTVGVTGRARRPAPATSITATWQIDAPTRYSLPTARSGASVPSFATSLVGGVWGWLPLLSLSAASGVLLLALADDSGRVDSPWADFFFWLGLAVIFLPIVSRLVLGATASRWERIGLVLVGGVGLYFVRLLQYPAAFALNDEFQHWRTAQDIASSHHLFDPNPILPISPSFPGLEIVTNAVSSLSGLPIFPVGMLLVGLARALLVLALFLFYEMAGRSTRLAAIAAALYLANPSILFDDGQYGYEALALPLGVLALCAVVRASHLRGSRRLQFLALAALLFGAMAITHHITSLLFLGFLMWMMLGLVLRGSKQQRLAFGLSVAVAVTAIALWFVLSGDQALTYLSWYPRNSLTQLVNLLSGSGHTRTLFAHWGQPIPDWERILSFAAVAVIMLALPVGWLEIRRHRRTDAIAGVLATAALAYPVSLALRLVPAGVDGATRLMAWSFIPAAFLLAVVIRRLVSAQQTIGPRYLLPHVGYGKAHVDVRRFSPTTWRWYRPVTVGGVILLAGVVFLGSMVIGAGLPWRYTPGPFLAAASARSVTPEGIEAASWMRDLVGPQHKIATDEENQLLMATYGGQNPVTDLSGRYEPSWLFTAASYGAPQEQLVRQLGIQYIVVDLRLSTALPASGTYFDEGEPGAFQHEKPLDRAALDKFDGFPGVNRIFDNGAIAIYGTGEGS